MDEKGSTYYSAEEEALRVGREAQAELAAIVESSEDGIIGKTLDGVITTWNYAAERMFGYTAAEMVGRSIYALIPLERHHEEEEIRAGLMLGKRMNHLETVRVA